MGGDWRRPPLALWAPCGVLALLMWESWPVTVDDAYISLRHARHWVEFANPSFDPGLRIEAYSNFGAVALSAGVLALGADPLWAMKALGGLCAFATLWLAFGLARRLGASAGFAVLGAGLLSVSVGFGFWAVSGMETLLFTLLLTGGVALLASDDPRARAPAAALFAAAALTRLEGPVLVGAAIGAHLLTRRGPVLRIAREHAWVAGVALVYIGYFAWRWHYYGHLFPSPIYFKRIDAGGEVWRSSSAAFVRGGWPLLLLAAGAPRFAGRRAAAPLAVVAAALVAFAGARQTVLGDVSTMNWFHRYFVPVLPCLVAAAMATLSGASRALGPALARRVGVGVVAAFLLAWQLTNPTANPLPLLQRTRSYPMAVAARNVPAALYLQERYGDAGSVVGGDVGALGYFFRGRVWDLFGLASYERTLRHDGALEPWVAELLAREPDAIQLCYDAKAHDPPRPCLHSERVLAEQPAFRAGWVRTREFGRELFPESYYAIFERR